MQFGVVLRTVGKPFQNLSTSEKTLLWTRLISSVVAFLMSLVVILGPISMPLVFYMGKLNSYTADISLGLFHYVKASGGTKWSSSINNGVGLTTSETLILSAYILTKLEKVPQLVTVTPYGDCLVRFDTQSLIQNGKHIHIRNSTVDATCINRGNRYVFNYRELLSELGLNIILSYAYSNNDVEADSGFTRTYNEYVDLLTTRKIDMLNLLCVVTGLQFVTMVLTLIYYGIKGRFINSLREKLVLHFASLLSMVSIVCAIAAFLVSIWINISLQKKIDRELSTFGFSYDLGLAWFLCLGVTLSATGSSFVLWSGLEWCVVSRPEITDQPATNILAYEAGVVTHMKSEPSPQEQPQLQNESKNPVILRTILRPDEPSTGGVELELRDLSRVSTHSSSELNQPLQPSSTMYF